MSTNVQICPICEEGKLTQHVEKNPVEYKGDKRELDCQYSVCDACGSEQADAQQLRTNKRLMVVFKKEVDGLLTGAEVRAVRERLGLTQKDAALVFGGGPVAFSKYENDEVIQSDSMDKLLRLADQLPAAFVELCRRAGVKPKMVKPQTAPSPGITFLDVLYAEIQSSSSETSSVAWKNLHREVIEARSRNFLLMDESYTVRKFSNVRIFFEEELARISRLPEPGRGAEKQEYRPWEDLGPASRGGFFEEHSDSLWKKLDAA